MHIKQTHKSNPQPNLLKEHRLLTHSMSKENNETPTKNIVHAAVLEYLENELVKLKIRKPKKNIEQDAARTIFKPSDCAKTNQELFNHFFHNPDIFFAYFTCSID